MRGEAAIKAAARDDQETANRNGNKRDWRREKLGTLLDKLEEEYREFVKDVTEGYREGMRWEGSDLRWCVTMIQDHGGVLEEVGEEKQELATKYYECWQDAEARCLALETWLKTVEKRREAAESRATQLEEALDLLREVAKSKRWMKGANRVGIDFPIGLWIDMNKLLKRERQRAALSSEPSQGSTVQEVTKEQALDIVSPSEAPEKEGE